MAQELAAATLGMIAGQYLDIDGGGSRAELNRLKTGRLFDAAVGCGLWAAGVPEPEQGPWRDFGADFGFLYQVVDDLLDEDGLVREDSARARLLELDADTSVLDELVDELVTRVR